MDQVSYSLAGAVATYSAKSALFTAGYADQGTFFDSTGTFTITLDTASMSAGWSAWFRCVSGTQTLDPTSTTLINGASTYAVSNAGDVVLVEYTGSAFVISHSQRPASVAITGGTINGTTIGATTETTGRFTTVESTVTTGTAPLIVASTTAVANLNASLLLGSTWAAPAAIGSGTPAAGSFTTLTASSTLAVTGVTTTNGIQNDTGDITSRADADAQTILGRVRLGFFTGLSDNAAYAHYDHATSSSYAMRQDSSGGTVINSASGQNVRLSVANTASVTVTATAVTLATTVSSGLIIAAITGKTLDIASTATICAAFAGGATFGSVVVAPATSTSRASIRLPHGTAPTSPVDGDMWTTTAGLFVRINGSTVGPLA